MQAGFRHECREDRIFSAVHRKAASDWSAPANRFSHLTGGGTVWANLSFQKLTHTAFSLHHRQSADDSPTEFSDFLSGKPRAGINRNTYIVWLLYLLIY